MDEADGARSDLCTLLSDVGGYETLVVRSIAEARRRVHNPWIPREGDLDLILVDLETAGIEACCCLRAEPEIGDVPVIMLTSTADPDVLVRAFEAGAVDYIMKPFQQVAVLARIRSAVALKRETDARKAKERDLVAKNLELQRAIREIQVLRGLIKICSLCKKVQNDQGHWQQVELYIREHSEAEFTHGICADCARDHYPDLLKDI